MKKPKMADIKRLQRVLNDLDAKEAELQACSKDVVLGSVRSIRIRDADAIRRILAALKDGAA